MGPAQKGALQSGDRPKRGWPDLLEVLLLAKVPARIWANRLLGDKAYDADQFIAQVHQGRKIVILPKRNRQEMRDYDRHIYKERHLVECFFAKIKQCRRVATRYEKLALTFKAVVMIAACLVWLD